ncbi:TetR/AcrR family transcriptional regulator [Flexivirga caeni]|uniref:TetR/AcrR family transcriptional regulator n=1 Tax=Flexivirga caeni TaxID=2294115 RepID=A0A3M9M9R0_9MICO|nr:TetR/AcrR family transcriptional regulator [Flexivirga caeni]RNI22236.1 TetR/AcrR family transcriptional regulator [Flexivirga caeni]
MVDSPTKPATRRRGRALEDALLDAAWMVLERAGYAGLTMDAVAAEASTSKSVLYRRWPSRSDLVLAMVLRRVPMAPQVDPDTGTLSGDLRALLRQVSERFISLGAAVPALAAELPGNPEIVEASRVAFGAAEALAQNIADRAAERGEIPTARLAPATLRAPLNLARFDLLMTMQPLDEAAIDALVNEVALPLYGASRSSCAHDPLPCPPHHLED